MKTKEWFLWNVVAGNESFQIVATSKNSKSSFIRAMETVFKRYGAKTSADLPKPFDMTCAEGELVVLK